MLFEKNIKKLSSCLIILITMALLPYCLAFHMGKQTTNPTAHTRQMIVVIAKDWSSTTGILQRFERNSVKESWKPVGDKIDISLGKNGLGWGIGLHGSNLTKGPIIIEGASRSPVGVFELNLAFGKDDQEKLGIKLPYKPITNTVFCPDDPKSKFYNRIVDTKHVHKDWNSAEDMYQYMNEGVYLHGIVISHNYKKPIPE